MRMFIVLEDFVFILFYYKSEQVEVQWGFDVGLGVFLKREVLDS